MKDILKVFLTCGRTESFNFLSFLSFHFISTMPSNINRLSNELMDAWMSYSALPHFESPKIIIDKAASLSAEIQATSEADEVAEAIMLLDNHSMMWGIYLAYVNFLRSVGEASSRSALESAIISADSNGLTDSWRQMPLFRSAFNDVI